MNLNEFRARLKQLRVYKAEMERRLKRSPMRAADLNFPPLPNPMIGSKKQGILDELDDYNRQIMNEWLDPNIQHDEEWFKKKYLRNDRISDEWKEKIKQDPVELYWNQISDDPLRVIYAPMGNYAGCPDGYTAPIFSQHDKNRDLLNRLRKIKDRMDNDY